MANNAKHPQIPLLLTRPLGASKEFVAALPEHTRSLTRPIFSPLIEIVDLETPVPDAKIVIFTSATALEFSDKARGRRAYCVGEITTRKAKERGWNAIQMGQTANELVTKIIAAKPTAPLLHLAGRHTRGEIAERLTAAQVPTVRLALYEQKGQDLNECALCALQGKATVIVPLFSPRTTQQFGTQKRGNAPLRIIALSDAVAQGIGRQTEDKVSICSEPTRVAMMQEIKKTVLSLTLG